MSFQIYLHLLLLQSHVIETKGQTIDLKKCLIERWVYVHNPSYIVPTKGFMNL